MSIAQDVKLRDLGNRVAQIESQFREGAEAGNSRERLDNLEAAISGILLELQRLSKALATQNNEAAKEPQEATCQSSAIAKSAPSSAAGSIEPSTGPTRSSAQTAKMR